MRRFLFNLWRRFWPARNTAEYVRRWYGGPMPYHVQGNTVYVRGIRQDHLERLRADGWQVVWK